jgi:hypothetical protein
MNLQAAMIQEINAMRSNPVIMKFVEQEAREKVAADIREQMKGGTTAKAVELLEMRHAHIRERVQEYIAIGLVGCLMAKLIA